MGAGARAYSYVWIKLSRQVVLCYVLERTICELQQPHEEQALASAVRGEDPRTHIHGAASPLRSVKGQRVTLKCHLS